MKWKTSYLFITEEEPKAEEEEEEPKLFSSAFVCAIMSDLILSVALLPELLCGFLAVLVTHPGSKLSIYTDYFLSNRIYYAWVGLRKYGIHLLGNPIEWVGYGARPDMSAVEKTYNFVDCSYPFILLNFGILVFIGLEIFITSWL